MFLHGSQTDLRRVFIFLLEKLPKVKEQPICDNIDPLQRSLNKVRSQIAIEANKLWVPSFCRQRPDKNLAFRTDSSCLTSDWSKRVPSVPVTVLVPSLLEVLTFQEASVKYQQKVASNRRRQQPVHHQTEINENSSRLALSHFLLHSDVSTKKVKPQLPPKPGQQAKVEADAVLAREEHCRQLRAQLEHLEDLLKKEQEETERLKERVAQAKQSVGEETTRLEAQTKQVDREEKLLSLLPDAGEHVRRMEELLVGAGDKMAALEEQWQLVKQPLEDEYQQLVAEKERSGATRLRQELQDTVQDLRLVLDETRSKDEMIAACRSQLEAVPATTLTRSFYTQRILSIVANVKKQNEEMKRVLEDVKSIQREINGLQGKVDRIYTITDEMIFQAAKGDDAVRRIYKSLASLHGDCGEILRLVKESGALVRDIKDLEEQVETRQRQDTAAKLRQLTADLEQMRLENQQLQRQIGQR